MKKLAVITAALVMTGCTTTPNYTVPQAIKMDRAGSSLTYVWVETTGPFISTTANWTPVMAEVKARCQSWGYDGEVERFTGIRHVEYKDDYTTRYRHEVNLQCL